MENIVRRVRVWLLPAGILVFLGLITWRIESPRKLWWAACEVSAVLVLVAYRVWLWARSRHWNDRGVAALRAGELPPAPLPSPRGWVGLLFVGLALALAGLVLLVLDLLGGIGRHT